MNANALDIVLCQREHGNSQRLAHKIVYVDRIQGMCGTVQMCHFCKLDSILAKELA